MSIRRHTIYNLVGSILPIAVSLITVPIYLNLIGEARYGVLAIAWLMLGYFGLFDLGLGRATAQHIAALRNESSDARSQIFWTALIMNACLGAVGGLLIWPAATYFFGNVFKIDSALRPEVLSAVPWLMASVPLATLSGVLTGALQGREKFLELNVISVFGTIMFQLLPLLAAMQFGVSLSILLPSVMLSRLLTLIPLFVNCRKHITRGHKITFARTRAGELLMFGGWVTVTSFVGPMMTILDRFIIGSTVGAKSVTYYTIPFQLAEKALIIPGALSSALFPKLSSSDNNQQHELATNALRSLLVVITPIIIVGILLLKPFLSYWLNPDIAEKSYVIGCIILLGFWANSFAQIPYVLLQARRRPDIVAKCHIAQLPLYLTILYFGIHYFGLIGAAIAFSIRTFADFIILAGFAKILKQSLHLFIMPALLLIGTLIIAINSQADLMNRLLLIMGCVSVTLLWAVINAPESIRNLVIGAIIGSSKYIRGK